MDKSKGFKVLIVSSSDIKGGAARATNRLFYALLDQGVDCEMLVQTKGSDENRVQVVDNTRFLKLFGYLRPVIDQLPVKKYKKRTGTLFSPANPVFTKTIQEINRINPDIVHLHWICGGFLKIEDLSRIKAPIVWTIHDMWAFTGGCHYTENCDRYQELCGKCKVLGSRTSLDLSRRVYRRKRRTYKRLYSMRIVAVSNWLGECVRKSSLLNTNLTQVIPNPLNTEWFKNYSDKKRMRELWRLPQNKELILFGAIGGSRDLRKGHKELLLAISMLTRPNIELIIFGSSEPDNPPDLGYKTHYMGHLHDNISLLTLYNAVDVMVVPSLQEAFGQTASEAMACGVPVVSFGATGLLDIVDHKINGYLARPFEVEDLAFGIEWILNNPDYEDLSINARRKIEKEFDSKIVANQYIELYSEIISKA